MDCHEGRHCHPRKLRIAMPCDQYPLRHVDPVLRIYHDDYHATYDLTRLFLEKGRRNLGYLSAMQQDKAAGEARYRGFCDAVCGMGCEELAKHYVTAGFSVASGYEKTGELLKKYDDLDGLICATDAALSARACAPP